MKINQEKIPYTTKTKFLSNGSNQTELISKLVEGLCNVNITTICCRDNVNRAIVKESLQHLLLGTIEIWVENAGILITLNHHYDQEKHGFSKEKFMKYFALETWVNLLKSFKAGTVHSIKYEVPVLKYSGLFTNCKK